MNKITRMKSNIKVLLTILVVFLLGTNIAVIITFQNHLRSEAKEKEKQIIVPDSQLGRFFNDELNLDANQQEQFREFRRTYNRSASAILWEMEEVRSKMAKELNSARPARTQLDQLADQLGDKHKALKKLTFDYYFNMQSALKEEQQEKMVKIFQAMLTDEGNAKTTIPGSMNHRGQGQGRGWQTKADSVQ
jgi:Spy/CpxP family protein refolding chaperone